MGFIIDFLEETGLAPKDLSFGLQKSNTYINNFIRNGIGKQSTADKIQEFIDLYHSNKSEAEKLIELGREKHKAKHKIYVETWKMNKTARKKCGKCKKYKPYSEYYTSTVEIDGLYPYCMSCCKVNKSIETSREHYERYMLGKQG